MTDDDIARARQAIAEEAAGPTFISTRHGERYLAAATDPASGWSAALDEVERLRSDNAAMMGRCGLLDQVAKALADFEAINAAIDRLEDLSLDDPICEAAGGMSIEAWKAVEAAMGKARWSKA